MVKGLGISDLLPADSRRPLSGPEQAALEARLLELLAWQAGRYTMGDSTSLRTETAQELLASLCFTLGLYLQDSGRSPRLLLDTADLRQLLAQGRDILAQRVEAARELHREAIRTAPSLESLTLHGTLRDIGGFFRSYDYRFFAQRIPAQIDYQLCRPAPESLPGVEYISDYLRRIVAENALLQACAPQPLKGLLRVACPSWRELPLNLCAPALANGTARLLLGREPWSLQLNDEDRWALLTLAQGWTEEQGRQSLRQAGARLWAAAGGKDPYGSTYMAEAAADLWPRLWEAAAAQDLTALFPTPAA